ncbi:MULTISPECIES: phosphate acyltransferase PlsX [Syntrophothermus]|uniref:Phosphate acyltransferase n=1 Tax=Syntrophothermus lipocalidus (strain DSM 12680 / TGB-C1) TaxID=643648 RepID=D7CMX6_SYNLT|nr:MULTISPECIES: phosphate acyltransferase PlsX [Syntrophothermus]ADI02061.1 fatty acid/phospholipid synthesis protein PlsX [Syntrophothermus lipocalidus DSM 12680]NSW82481.1 phosphate acyltransferase PlsX [Syntrophothermus sp.]
MRVAVDAMGGDYAPREVVRGAVEAINKLGIEVILVGDQEIVGRELSGLDYDRGKLTVVHSSQVIGMNEHPALALRKKKDSSIVVATGLVKAGEAQAVVSCGNTGAQMAAGVFVLGTVAGVERPAIAANIPLRSGQNTILLDIGANVDCKPRQLVQFALMGSAYASVVNGSSQPSVGMLSNGEEESKGNQAVLEAHAMLKKETGINFIGNVEGRDIFVGKSEVVVCDGFVGNVVLKAVEGFMGLLMDTLKEALSPEVLRLLKSFDYNQVGGAPLLGVNGVSIVCHGSSKAQTVTNGVKAAVQCVENDMVGKLKRALGVD